MKESTRAAIEATRVIAGEVGKFLALSMREPIEYALDEISAKGFKKGIRTATGIPFVSTTSGLAAGIFSENVILGASVGVAYWLALGIGERLRWMWDHE